MDDLLFLAHRIPYPPNKGDKIRSYHFLKYLSQYYRVHLGTFIDDVADRQYIPLLNNYCTTSLFVDLSPIQAKARSLLAMLSSQPLSLPYYSNVELKQWVQAQITAYNIKKIFVFSGVMAQFVDQLNLPLTHRIVDFVDVDSDKWRQYSEKKSWPMNWVYAREARTLLRYEKHIAKTFSASLFVSEPEAALFKKLSGDDSNKIGYINNGVDTVFFSPQHKFTNPYPDSEAGKYVVFIGAMDYWANVDAVTWFATKVFPTVRIHQPDTQFYIVGVNPTKAVQRLSDIEGVTVTGAVADVRPFLAYADAVVVPLRVARGVQNKVLEAMAMAKVTIVTAAALEGIKAMSGQDIVMADDITDFIQQTLNALSGEWNQVAEAARQRVVNDYSWNNSLQKLTDLYAS